MISHTAMATAECKLDIEFTKDTPYLALMGELCCVCCEGLEENWPRYNSIALQNIFSYENSQYRHHTRCPSIQQDMWHHLRDQWLTNVPDSKVHGANTGLIWGRQDPGGPHVGPMNFAIRGATLINGVLFGVLGAAEVPAKFQSDWKSPLSE